MGMIHIYCGDGKGKTSAAVGLAIRAAGRGIPCVIARFLKTDDSGEVLSLKYIPEIYVLPCEKTFGFTFSMDEKTKAEAALYCGKLFEKAVSEAAARRAGVLVLDEIMAAVSSGMVSEERLLTFLNSRPERLEIVMTGRDPSKAVLEAADYVSEIKKISHPYDRGILARRGIEY